MFQSGFRSRPESKKHGRIMILQPNRTGSSMEVKPRWSTARPINIKPYNTFKIKHFISAPGKFSRMDPREDFPGRPTGKTSPDAPSGSGKQWLVAEARILISDIEECSGMGEEIWIRC